MLQIFPHGFLAVGAQRPMRMMPTQIHFLVHTNGPIVCTNCKSMIFQSFTWIERTGTQSLQITLLEKNTQISEDRLPSVEAGKMLLMYLTSNNTVIEGVFYLWKKFKESAAREKHDNGISLV